MTTLLMMFNVLLTLVTMSTCSLMSQEVDGQRQLGHNVHFLRVERKVLTTSNSKGSTSNEPSASQRSGDARGQQEVVTTTADQVSDVQLFLLSQASLSTKPDLSSDVVILRPTCHLDADCDNLGTKCDHFQSHCNCPKGYFDGQQSGHSESGLRFCLRAAGYGEPCLDDHQCVVVNNTHCQAGPMAWTSSDFETGRQCLCRDAFFPSCKYTHWL